MKTLALVIIATALPFAAVAQDGQKKSAAGADPKAAKAEPAKNKISFFRIAVKQGHDAAFKAAIAAHAQKFHKGDWSWRVGSVVSGPDAGMYHITEGTFSWTALDGREDLGAEHMKDFETAIAPHVEKVTGDTFLSYQTSLSTVPASQWSDKVVVQHFAVKLGRGAAAVEWMRKWKPVTEKLGQNIAIWRTTRSGEDLFSVVWRLKSGWKDMEVNPWTQKVFDETVGAGEFAKVNEALPELFTKVWHEMIEFKPELSSK